MIAQEELRSRVVAFVGAQMAALRGASVVLAASGGVDSSALVGLLCAAGLINRERAAVAHFDHRLREPQSAVRDLSAVVALCERYGLSLVTGAWYAPVSGEAAAREARYRFLAGVAAKHRAAFIVTGHTADDQAETVLMHALRGAGLHGLAGMTPVAPLPVAATLDVRIARPLLCVAHEEARSFCIASGIAWSEDASNDDVTYTRNRVRHALLPRLDDASPGVRDQLLTMSRDVRALADAMDAAVTHVLPTGDQPFRGDVVLDRAAVRALPRELATYAWRAAVVRLLGDARDFGRKHFETLAGAADARTGATFALPRGVVATVDPASITLSRGPLTARAIAPDLELPLPFAGVVGNWWVEARDATSTAAATCWAPAGAVIRGRRPGDRIRLTSHGRKKLQDDFVDRRVPRRERDAVPVIASGSDVLWTPFRSAPRRIDYELRPVVVQARRANVT